MKRRLTCALCGHESTNKEFIYSKHTKRAYCRDNIVCSRRQTEQWKAMNETFDRVQEEAHAH